jgi:hypothetical protein
MTGNARETRMQRREREAAAFAARYTAARAAAGPVVRTPLTAGQHILHLLLTVLTGGLWGIVWIIRATQGNRRAARG